MPPSEFKAIRKGLGLTDEQWGKLLGYKCNPNAMRVLISQMESGKQRITPQVALLAESYRDNGVPRDRLALLGIL